MDSLKKLLPSTEGIQRTDLLNSIAQGLLYIWESDDQLFHEAMKYSDESMTNAFVMPGLIDCHTHVLLQGDITSEDYNVQLLKESTAYRTIRAVKSCHQSLMNGFTTIRDLGTEGAGYADVDLKRAIEKGEMAGPRMLTLMASKGIY